MKNKGVDFHSLRLDLRFFVKITDLTVRLAGKLEIFIKICKFLHICLMYIQCPSACLCIFNGECQRLCISSLKLAKVVLAVNSTTSFIKSKVKPVAAGKHVCFYNYISAHPTLATNLYIRTLVEFANAPKVCDCVRCI